MQYWIQYLIIGFILIFILLIVLKATKKDFHVEANKLVDYLGGKDNIISMEVNMSRFKVTLRDVSIDKNHMKIHLIIKIIYRDLLYFYLVF